MCHEILEGWGEKGTANGGHSDKRELAARGNVEENQNARGNVVEKQNAKEVSEGAASKA